MLLSEIDAVQNQSVELFEETVAGCTSLTGSCSGTISASAETKLWVGGPSGCGATHTCYPPAVNYDPRYYLINGVAFDKNNVGTSSYAVPNEDEDFGLEQITGNSADRYKFRSSPLRNAALQPAFFHNGAFTRIEDAIRHHLDVRASVRNYNAEQAGVALDLTFRLASPEAMLSTLDPVLENPIHLEDRQFDDLVNFVRDGLLDDDAREQKLCTLVPHSVPSGLPVLHFEGCSAK